MNPFEEVNKILVNAVNPVGKEYAELDQCSGRILGTDLVAKDNVPPFERSPLDGYAIYAEDTKGASKENPVTLKILEEIPAGAVAHYPVTPGTATKILTGSPMPEGANAVVRYESTDYTEEQVTLYQEVKPGSNVITIGEDIMKGTVMAEEGTVIDFGVMGSLSAQNEPLPLVYKIPKIGIISTGNELVDAGSKLAPGQIYNTSRYTLKAAFAYLGCETVYLGTVNDDAQAIADLITKGIESFDAVFLTGGVSAGDYDLTPKALELAGAEVIFRGGAMRPCVYGTKDGKLIGSLTGSPASAAVDFFIAAEPAIKKLAGHKDYMHKLSEVTVASGYKKASKGLRALRGTVKIEDGLPKMTIPKEQGHVMVSSLIGCNAIAFVPGGTGPLEPGMKLEAILI